MWSELIQPGAWPGLAGRAPRPAMEECSVLSGPRGAESDSRGGEGIGEMQDAAVFPCSARKVGCGFRVGGGRGRPTQGVPWGVAAYFSHFP